MSPLQAHILELLANETTYARALHKRSDQIRVGTIYKVLSRMEGLGYVTSEGRAGAYKRLYKLTDLGYRTLKGYRAMEACIHG